MVRQFIQGREAVVRQFVQGWEAGRRSLSLDIPVVMQLSTSALLLHQSGVYRWTKNTGYLNWVPEGQSSPSRLDVFLNFLPTFFLHIYCTSMIYFSVVVFFLFSIFPCPLSCFPSLCYLFDANVKIVVAFTVQC